MGDLPHGFGQVATAVTCALALYVARPGAVEKVNNALVGGVVATFLGIVGLGVGSADFGALIAPANQHPEEVVNAFPILFLAMVFQNIVPTVTYQLEGDRDKITTAIVVGTTLPMLMFLAWNAVILGNVMGIDPTLLTQEDPVQLLQSLSDGAVLGNLVGAFSELALVTSLIGFVYGLRDAWTDVLGIDQNKVEEYERYKPLLFAGIFAPPLLLSMANPDIFYHALDYGGAFGVSTLFLVLPPIMVWKQRYGEDNEPLSTKPMVPLGKIPLGSMWKAAATLIIEQGADKLGIVDFFREQM
uniref:Amino acid transporter n=1 Tax=Grammatophora oceanica TaxID=210454 RepID=A0A7S1UV57_9STRA